MRRQQFSDDAPVGLAAEDVIVEVAGHAEAFLHRLAFGFAPDAAADEQRAVNIEKDETGHAPPSPNPFPPSLWWASHKEGRGATRQTLESRVIAYSKPSMAMKEASAAPSRNFIAA